MNEHVCDLDAAGNCRLGCGFNSDVEHYAAIARGEDVYGEVPAVRLPHDPVSHPFHYTSHPSGVEPITITRHETFCLGNVIKYCMRAKYKGNEIQDLRKAAQYLQWEIERLQEGL